MVQLYQNVLVKIQVINLLVPGLVATELYKSLGLIGKVVKQKFQRVVAMKWYELYVQVPVVFVKSYQRQQKIFHQLK